MAARNRFLAPLVVGAMAAVAAISLVIYSEFRTPSVVDESEITINNKGERIYKDRPFTGEIVSYYDNGVQESAGQFADGRRHGYSKRWFYSGLLGAESHYESGTRNGTSKTWWSSGTQRSEVLYVDGIQEGTGWLWYESGAEYKKTHFENGRMSGLQQSWRENGDILANYEFRNGRIYGLKKSQTCLGVEDEVIALDYYEKNLR